MGPSVGDEDKSTESGVTSHGAGGQFAVPAKAPVPIESVTEPGSLGAAVTGHVAGKRGSLAFDIRGTGLTAAAIVSGGSLFAVLYLGDPMHNPAHFMSGLFAAFVAGMLTNAIVGRARVSEALKEKENYRREMERAAEAKRRVEDQLLKRRLSSAPPDPKKKGGK